METGTPQEAPGELADHQSWVRQMLVLFPVPRPDLERPLLEALLRISKAVPWLQPVLGYSATDRLTSVLATLPKAGSSDRAAAQTALVGDYSFTGTMVGTEAIPMPGPDQLRAALWVCHEQWSQAGNQKSGVTKAFASAIRNTVKMRTKGATDKHAIAQHLPAIQAAGSLEEFLTATKVFLTSEQSSVREAWPEIERQLLGLIAKQGKPKPPVRPTTVAEPTSIVGYDEDQAIEELINGIRQIAVLPLPDTADLLPDEPLAEAATLINVVPVSGVASNPDARRMAEYKAKQVVWNQNSLLLTNHPDVLPAELLRQVLATLIAEMQTTESDAMRVGLAGLLCQAVTGRTTKSLLAAKIVDRFDRGQTAACEFSLLEAAIRIQVFFAQDSDKPNGYYRPAEGQAAYLEPVGKSFLLPLPAAVVSALRSREVLSALLRTNEKDLDSQIRGAARHVSSLLNTSIVMGQVRRSFSAHLFELCRDTALTQLICADTLGQSDAPPHYFAPKVSLIADTYSALLNSIFRMGEPGGACVESDARVGARLLVRPEVARAMTSSIGAVLNTGVERLVSGNQIRTVHQAMICQLACMFMIACTHRPTNALFKLLLTNIDLDHGTALFQDKIHDPAHNPRLVALPSSVVRQIQAYLAHLHGLAAVMPKLAPLVDKILAGKAPLLFGLDADGKHESLSIDVFAELLPPEWRLVPLNWGRTWVRTRGVELGIPPELVSIQMGHLEAVGYPFSNASPTEPLNFVAVIRPILDRMADGQGWTVRHGIAGPKVSNLPQLPLKLWASKVRQHEQAAREVANEWRNTQKAHMKSYRRQAEEYVLAHPAIANMGIDVLYANKTGPWQKHPLTRDGAELLRDVMFEEAGNDIAMGFARSEALSRILKWVNKRVGMKDEVPARLIAYRRPVDNAFVPEMMLAVRQVRDLRQSAMDRSVEGPGNWRDFGLACARTAFALAAFGFCDSPEQIQGVIENRGSIVRSAALRDALLVKWGPDAEQVVGLRGLAAISVAKLAKKYPTGGAPPLEEINRGLAAVLPAWAFPVSEPDSPEVTIDLLALLCETVSVSNRLEQSPAARMVLDHKQGSVPAHWREQIALLDADPLHAVSREWEESEEQADVDGLRLSVGRRTGSSRMQYLKLCRTIPVSGNDLDLPLTEQKVAAGDLNAPDTRLLVIAEIEKQTEQTAQEKVLHPIVRLLAGWVLEMLEEGTEKTENPANDTISTYLTRIGGALVEIFGSASLIDLDDTELEDAYLAVVESKRESAKAATAVISFHDTCMRKFGFPELDLSEVRAYLNSEARSVDAKLVLPVERDAAMHRLTKKSEEGGNHEVMTHEKVRVQRQASAGMPFYAYAGGRRSEVLGIQYQDAYVNDNGITFVRIRANNSRRLKTRAARRIIEFSMIPKTATGQFTKWYNADRSRLPKWRHANSYVFSPLEDGRRADGRAAIASACASALAQSTGRRSEKIHRLRHLVAFERVTPLFLSDRDFDALTHLVKDARSNPMEIVLPRDIAAQVITLGHAHWLTTLRCYHHVPWLLRSRADANMSARYMSRRAAAAVMGLTLQAVDRLTQMSKGISAEQAWLDSAISRRIVPSTPGKESGQEMGVTTAWSARELGQLLAVVERTGSLESALQVVGGGAGEMNKLRAEFLTFEKRLGRRIVAGEWVDLVGMPKRVVRDLENASVFECWWSIWDAGSAEQRKLVEHIADEIFECMSPKDGDSITIRSEELSDLMMLLTLAGIAESDVESHSLALGIHRVRVIRSIPPKEEVTKEAESEKEPAVRYLGLAIKRALGVIWVARKLRLVVG